MRYVENGRIICFEGIDGAGKHTQAALLMKRLRRSGRRAKVYSYPDYSSQYGKIIDRYLHGDMQLGRREHFFLFLIDIIKDQEKIRKELRKGTVIIMDRYFYTALAYICPSGFDYDIAKGFVKLMDFVYPSLVIYLDIPASITWKRKGMKGLDKFERDQEFLNEVKVIYEAMIKERYTSKRWVRIDASVAANAVHEEVMKAIGESI